MPKFVFQSTGRVRTIFPTSDEKILNEVERLASVGYSKQKFVDMDDLCLKCLVCGYCMVGQTEAIKHSMETTHDSFDELWR
ncbi:aminotransferase [Homalodisca vitripennis]|nr:aminotransferase [Homalodisca vitripennis]